MRFLPLIAMLCLFCHPMDSARADASVIPSPTPPHETQVQPRASLKAMSLAATVSLPACAPSAGASGVSSNIVSSGTYTWPPFIPAMPLSTWLADLSSGSLSGYIGIFCQIAKADDAAAIFQNSCMQPVVCMWQRFSVTGETTSALSYEYNSNLGLNFAFLQSQYPVVLSLPFPTTPLSNYPDLLAHFSHVIISVSTLLMGDNVGNILTINGAPVSSSAPYCATCGDPVNVATGSMWHEFLDAQVKGRTRATDLIFKRTYLSQTVSGEGDFGSHWFHSYETKILAVSYNQNTNLVWIDQNGGAWTFVRNSDNSFVSPPGFFGSLTEFTDRYELKQKHGITFVFTRDSSVAPVGRLISIKEPHGEQVRLSYLSGKLASISSGFAGTLSIGRGANGLISRVSRNRDGINYFFNYDANNNLVNSTDAGRQLTFYQYTSVATPSGPVYLLSGFTDPLVRRTQFSYDSKLRMISQTDHGGGIRRFSYSPGVTEVQDIDGSYTDYQFDSSFRTVSVIKDDHSSQSYTWNAKNQMTSVTDELGFVTKMDYDSRGNLNSIKKPLDASPVLISYDQNFDVPTLIQPLTGAKTKLVVDPVTGDITSVKREGASGALSLAFTHDSFGNTLQTKNDLKSYQDVYNSNGLLTLKFDARNPESRSYDFQGRLIQRKFSNGRTLSYAFDVFDRITSITDSAGPSVGLQYDSGSRLIYREVSDGVNLQYSFYSWDERDHLTAVADSLGNRTQFTYDVSSSGGIKMLDHPVTKTDAKGNVWSNQYDSLQRLVSTTDPNGGITRYAYNLRGDLIQVTDPLNGATRYTVDGNGRVTTRSRPSVAGKTAVTEVTRNDYNLNGEKIRETTSSSKPGEDLVKEYALDDFGRMIGKTLKRVKHGTVLEMQDDSRYAYLPILENTVLTSANNAVENLSFSPEAAPPFADLSFRTKAGDSRNSLNLVEDTFNLDLDPTGGFAKVSNSKTTYLKNTFDPAGRMLEAVGIGSSVGSRETLDVKLSYDTFGRKSGVKTSDGLTQKIEYDLDNRISSLIWNKGSHHSGFNADPDFQENITRDENGLVVENDQGTTKLKYAYDRLGQLTKYDAKVPAMRGLLGNLFGFLGRPKAIEMNRSFGYDLNGNRVSDSQLGAGNYLNNFEISNQDEKFQADEDGLGSVATETNSRSHLSRNYKYRLDGKLVSFSWTEGPNHSDWNDRDPVLQTVNYYYDALGRRVAKQNVRSCRRFNRGFTQSYAHLDQQDRIFLATSGDREKFLYVDGNGIDEHLGMISRKGSTYFVTDHLGSVMNSGAFGDLSSFGPFGETIKPLELELFQNNNPVLYGFAGRQLDPESGRYYSRARMYNQDMGRFMSKDPIGFNGGDLNLYRYVGNSPVNYLDPNGECFLQIGAALALGLIAIDIIYDSYFATSDNPATPQRDVPPSMGPASSPHRTTYNPGEIEIPGADQPNTYPPESLPPSQPAPIGGE